MTLTKSLVILSLILKSCTSNGNENISNQDSLNETKNIETQTISTKQMSDSNFLPYWQIFRDVIRTGNKTQFKKISLDSLECEHINIHVDDFVNKYFAKVFDDSLLIKLTDSSGKMDFINAAMESTYFSPFIRQQIKNANYTIKEVNITKGKYPDILITTLKFIETDGGYKFYGYDRFGG